VCPNLDLRLVKSKHFIPTTFTVRLVHVPLSHALHSLNPHCIVVILYVTLLYIFYAILKVLSGISLVFPVCFRIPSMTCLCIYSRTFLSLRYARKCPTTDMSSVLLLVRLSYCFTPFRLFAVRLSAVLSAVFQRHL